MTERKPPRHIGIIMDGNGRWAKKRMMPRIFGHKQGIKTVKKIVEYSGKIGLEYLTLYTFSTENWNRPEEEVSALMNLLYENLISQLAELKEKNVRLKTIGYIDKLPDKVKKEFHNAQESLKDNDGLTLIIAINYGGRNEIIRSIKKIYQDIQSNLFDINDLNENSFSQFLDTNNIPDPELIIRTSGEFRTSNFLLYQSAYSEYYISNKYWPDFNEDEMNQAIESYKNRNRRFGSI